MDSFLERITLLAAGRTLNSWLTVQLGWSTGDVDRIRNGHVPKVDKLIPLVTEERVNLSWLLTGEGAPYLVEQMHAGVEQQEFWARFPESDGWSHGWSGLGNGNSVMAAFRRPATLYVCLAFINFPLLDFDLKKPEIEIPTHELGKLARGWVGGIHYWNLLPQVRRDSLAIGEPRGAYKMPTKAYDTELKWRLDLAVAQLPDDDIKALAGLAERLVVRSKK